MKRTTDNTALPMKNKPSSLTGPRLADRVALRLSEMIAEQGLKPGDRLPAERELSQQMGVSRSSLREAIQKLTAQNQLYARQGGGTYVRKPTINWFTQTVRMPLEPLFESDPAYGLDVLEARHGLESNAAYHAALRATPQDKARILECFERMAACHGRGDPMIEARADADFHLAIVEASHNLVLKQVVVSLYELVEVSISRSLSKLYVVPEIYDRLEGQHRDLMDAVLLGNGEQAAQAAADHLYAVKNFLAQFEEEDARQRRAKVELPKRHDIAI
ncbi:FCD domain-containing protein [Kozakia baliensis]|nr:FCD domain-containing protein [Kozakia baliensis]GBR26635.1 GntR family transcriptional regulator [Kozakia baliensis NRIC 0488]GEL64307.1 transcriptional regulator LldR [Kozakia baliensis]